MSTSHPLPRQRRETSRQYATRLWMTWRLDGSALVLSHAEAVALVAPYGVKPPRFADDRVPLAAVALRVASADR